MTKARRIQPKQQQEQQQRVGGRDGRVSSSWQNDLQGMIRLLVVFGFGFLICYRSTYRSDEIFNCLSSSSSPMLSNVERNGGQQQSVGSETATTNRLGAPEPTDAASNVDAEVVSSSSSSSSPHPTSSDSDSDSAMDPAANNLPKYQKHPWDGIPKQEVGHALVQKESVDFIDDSRRLFIDSGMLEEFLKVYEGRPDKTNMCGMRINHSYSLFLAIRSIKPTAIIESGVNAGHSTYIMRAAAGPDTKIYPIDPLDQPICKQNTRWIDTTTNNTEYYTGQNFKDLPDIDWTSKIKSGEVDPERTLVLLDDHLDPSTRYPTLLKYGFRHILFEDNYKKGKGATSGDKAGWLPKQLFHVDNKDSQFFWQITKRYAEFPPIAPPIMAKESTEPSKKAGGFLHHTDDLTTLVAPLLRPDLDTEDQKLYEKICESVKADPRLRDIDSYMQLMNYNQFAYMELVPLAPRLLEFWK